MSVCATCLQPGIRDGQHDCPGLGDIQLTRQLGRGLRVDTAPARARMALNVLADHGYGLAMQGDDLVNIADQVLYQVVGYDPESAALVLELVEDWRPKRAARPTDGCPDCHVPPGQPHNDGCDVAHCTECGRQRITCKHGSSDAGWGQIWGGPTATVCTPISAETLTRMSEVPAGLLPEGCDAARGTLQEVLDTFTRVTSPTSGTVMGYQAPPIHPDDMTRWRAALDEPDEKSPVDQQEQPSPVDWQAIARDRERELKLVGEARRHAEVEVDRLRAGEEPGWDPLVVPTPGQWIARWNGLDPTERLRAAEAHIRVAEIANRCEFQGHTQRLDEAQQAQTTVARVRDLRDAWLLMTLEPGQVRRLLDEITRALDGQSVYDITQAEPDEAPPRINPPDGTTILAARHLDATEGRVQVGSIVDTSTRSAIDRVLGYVTKAHNSPTAPETGEAETAQPDGASCLCGCRKKDHKPWCHGCGTECTYEPDDTTHPDPPGFVPTQPVAQSWGETTGDPLVVEPYRNDRGESAWVFRCWGVGTCDGWLSLNHYSQESAERARKRHVAEEHGAEPGGALPWWELSTSGLLWLINRTVFHPRGLALTVHADGDTAYGWSLVRTPDGEPWQFDDATDADGRERAEATLAAALNPSKEQPMPTCTATIDGPHVLGGGPVQCTREAGHPENHVGPARGGDGKALWTDHHAGAVPHGAPTPEDG